MPNERVQRLTEVGQLVCKLNPCQRQWRFVIGLHALLHLTTKGKYTETWMGSALRNRVLLEKLIVVQLVTKFAALY